MEVPCETAGREEIEWQRVLVAHSLVGLEMSSGSGSAHRAGMRTDWKETEEGQVLVGLEKRWQSYSAAYCLQYQGC